jgi:3-hydroxymyristoyl/3-hydroxydecanoyl-(acyl carrier protein) dehydratase
MAAPRELPHAYPFRFVDAVVREAGPEFGEGRVSAQVTANGRAAMGASWAAPVFLPEAIAQAALLLQGGDPEIGRRGFLAGIEDFEILRPPDAGETLSVDVRLTARFGAIVKFEGSVRSGSETLAHGAILVRQGTAASDPEAVEA